MEVGESGGIELMATLAEPDILCADGGNLKGWPER